MLSLRTITGYVFSTVDPQASVRKATAYALTTAPIVASVRKVAAYALTKTPVPLAKGKSGLEQLFALINTSSKALVFTANNLLLGEIVAESYQGYNTKIKVSATLQTIGYSGFTYLRYNRVSISRSFEDSVEIGFTIPAATTLYGLLDKLNTAHNLKLVPDDIVDAPVRAGANSLTLTAASTSYVYRPGTKILLGSPYQNLADIITVDDLPGFDRVFMELSEIITVDDLPGFDPVSK